MNNLVKDLTKKNFFRVLLYLFVLNEGHRIAAALPSEQQRQAPSNLVLDSNFGFADDTIPTITVTVSETGGYVTLYSNKTCKTAVSSAVPVEDMAAPYKVDIKPTKGLKEGFYKFYAKHDNSSCSQSAVDYAYFKTLGKFRGANIFRGLLLLPDTKPFLVDYDKDGDLDIVVGQRDGTLKYFEKKDSGFFEEKIDGQNPFKNIHVEHAAAPFLIDYTEDGKLELIVGSKSGKLFYYVKDGRNIYVDKTQDSKNPFKEVKVTSHATPFFENLNNNSALELVVGEGNGKLNYYQKNVKGLYERVLDNENPFRNVSVISHAAPSLNNLDNDDDLELIVGTGDGRLFVYDKDMSNIYVLKPHNHPFSRINAGGQTAPFLINLDDDSDLELILGQRDGILDYYDKNAKGTYISSIKFYSPLSKINVGKNAAPFLINLDRDNALELVIANSNGILNVFDQNSDNIYVVQNREENPFNALWISSASIINFANVDNDSQLELLVGDSQGNLKYFDQDKDDVYVPVVNHPFTNFVTDGFVAPFLVNVDRDDKLELLLGTSTGKIRYYDLNSQDIYIEKIGNQNPFKSVVAEKDKDRVVPLMADFDNDKSLELLIGRLNGTLGYYKRNAKGLYTKQTGDKNFFRDIHVGSHAVPTYGDLNGDGRQALIFGNIYGYIYFAIPYKKNGRWVAFY